LERPDRPDRMERPERMERPDRTDRPERAARPEREDRPERRDRPERDRDRERRPMPEREPMAPAASDAPTPPVRERERDRDRDRDAWRPAASAESPMTTPAPARPASSAPAAGGASIDLSGGNLMWENEPTPGSRPGMSYGRQPAVKSRTGGVAPPTSDPTRRPTVSEAPASAPRSEPAPAATSSRGDEPSFKVDAQVREVKGPLPGVDATRYRAAEAPASRFSSETPTAWDEDPKEHD